MPTLRCPDAHHRDLRTRTAHPWSAVLGMKGRISTRIPHSVIDPAKPTRTPIVASRPMHRVPTDRQRRSDHRSARIAGWRLYGPACFIGAVVNRANLFAQIPIDLRAD